MVKARAERTWPAINANRQRNGQHQSPANRPKQNLQERKCSTSRGHPKELRFFARAPAQITARADQGQQRVPCDDPKD